MKLRIRVADPAGNVTVLVKTACPESAYPQIAEKLLAVVDGAEQVGFLTSPRYGGEVRLAMMGGEFCGNALRSAALCYSVEQGFLEEVPVAAEISGAAKPLRVLVDVKTGAARAEMILPRRLETTFFAEDPATAVCFDNIVHIVTERQASEFSAKEIKDELVSVCEKYRAAAAGLMFFDKKISGLIPAVYVLATDTLYFENSCASGSAAVAAFLGAKEGDGDYEFVLTEPGGRLTAAAQKRNGVLTAVTVGGKVALSPEMEVEI